MVLTTPASRLGGKNPKLVLLHLVASSSINAYGNLEAWPSLAYLSRLVGCSEKTVRRAMRDLERKALVTTMADAGRSNLYRINDELLVAIADIRCTLEDDQRCQYLAH